VSSVIEETILERVASGDPDAFNLCTDRYAGLVWSLARRMCPTRADAEDAVQEIFLAVWKSSARFDASQGSEATFIATIARRRLIDRLRKSGRRPGGAELHEGQATEAPAIAEATEASDESRRAREALKQLSEEQQRILQLAIYHGMSHEKIATSTGMPLGTVKAHVRRGLIRLREILGEAQPTGGVAGSGATR